MKNSKSKPAPIAKFAGCTNWTDQSAAWLAEASFLAIEPQGEVRPANGGDTYYATTDVIDAKEWCVIANFPHKPGLLAASFAISDRDLAFAAVLEVRGLRPVFYTTPTMTFEVRGSSVTGLISYVRSRDETIDCVSRVKKGGWVITPNMIAC